MRAVFSGCDVVWCVVVVIGRIYELVPVVVRIWLVA